MSEEEKFWKGLQELKEAMKETDRRISKLTDSWGRWVEGSVSPSAVKTFRKLGYKIFADYHRIKIYENNRKVTEYDTILVAEKDGQKTLFIGEAKSFFTSNDINDFINDLHNAKKLLKEFSDYQIIGFVAAMNYGEGADIYAIRAGIYIFKPSGEAMVVDVPKKFVPKIW